MQSVFSGAGTGTAWRRSNGCAVADFQTLCGLWRSVLCGLAPHNGNANGQPVDPLDAVCRAETDTAGKPPGLWGESRKRRYSVSHVGESGAQDGKATAVFTRGVWPNGNDKRRKGMWPKDGTAGIFLPYSDGSPWLPAEGETWTIHEGVEDAAAAMAALVIKTNAAGLPTCKLESKIRPDVPGRERHTRAGS